MSYPLTYRNHIHCPAQRLLHRGDSLAHEPTGYYQVEMGKVGPHVESKAVIGNPILDTGPQSDDLPFLIQPDPNVSRQALGSNAKLVQGPNHHFFQGMHIPAYVLTVVSQVYDRIAHQLPGAMVGHVAPPLNTTHLDAMFGQPLSGNQYVALISSPPESDHWRMLNEDQSVCNETGPSGLNQLVLQLKNAIIWFKAEVQHIQ